MTLLEKQILFLQLTGRLLRYASDLGIPMTYGETYRTPQQAAWNAAHGRGIAQSLHTERLAIDIQCYRKYSGQYQWLKVGNEPEYKLLGEYWKSLHELARWGGDFLNKHGDPKPDPGHFSLEHEGRK